MAWFEPSRRGEVNINIALLYSAFADLACRLCTTGRPQTDENRTRTAIQQGTSTVQYKYRTSLGRQCNNARPLQVRTTIAVLKCLSCLCPVPPCHPSSAVGDPLYPMDSHVCESKVARTYEWRCCSDCSDGRCCEFRGRSTVWLWARTAPCDTHNTQHCLLHSRPRGKRGFSIGPCVFPPERTEHPQLTQVQPVEDGCTHAVQVNFIFRLSRLEHHFLIWRHFSGGSRSASL